MGWIFISDGILGYICFWGGGYLRIFRGYILEVEIFIRLYIRVKF